MKTDPQTIRRCELWVEATPIKRIVWRKCECCNQSRPVLRTHMMTGRVCPECMLRAPRCTTPGCDYPQAYHQQQCRGCLVRSGESLTDEEQRESDLAQAVSSAVSALGRAQESSDAGVSIFSMRKKMDKSMKRMGLGNLSQKTHNALFRSINTGRGQGR